MGKLTYTGDRFYLDGEPYTVLSGAIHYFRVVPEYWEDSLKKLKACGLNTVETYTCWNLHERREGTFDFTGGLDVVRFVDLAASLGLHVILRPGPFICAEWDFGGLPSWLLQCPGIQLRCDNAVYLSKVRRYFQELFNRLGSRLASRGGPIYMVQIENEYGSYSHDQAYLRAIVDIYEQCGVDCLLFTADGSDDNMLTGGTLDGYLASVNFGDQVGASLDSIRRRGRTHPLMVGEYWCGQFDHWYEPHQAIPTDKAAERLDEILTRGASVNLYMFQGGTNFGFTNGANHAGRYQPDVTSYDYSAPLSEAGDRTDKYEAVQRVLEKHFGKAPSVAVGDTRKCAYGEVAFTEAAPLFDNLAALSAPIESVTPLTMEEVGQDFGFILYTTELTGPLEESLLSIHGLHDRAQLFLDGALLGILERDRREEPIRLPAAGAGSRRLDILVENLGRINFGPLMPYERKGIVGHVAIAHGGVAQTRLNWTIRPLPLEDLSALCYRPLPAASLPAFYRGTLRVEEIGDTFLALPGFGKGVAYINGFNLGRYWNTAGPQQTLYVPGPLLRAGDNALVIFELEQTGERAEFRDRPELDRLTI